MPVTEGLEVCQGSLQHEIVHTLIIV